MPGLGDEVSSPYGMNLAGACFVYQSLQKHHCIPTYLSLGISISVFWGNAVCIQLLSPPSVPQAVAMKYLHSLSRTQTRDINFPLSPMLNKSAQQLSTQSLEGWNPDSKYCIGYSLVACLLHHTNEPRTIPIKVMRSIKRGKE